MVSHFKSFIGNGKTLGNSSQVTMAGNCWSKDFVENPPSPPKVPNFVQYYYFEKDIELSGKNYVGWREGDMWLDADKCCDIDKHLSKRRKI